MKIFLSNTEPEDKSYVWINNIATLNDKISNAEAMHIVCDNFISNFTLAELSQCLAVIFSKMRLNCELIIRDIDIDLINRRYINEEITIEEANNLLFNSNQKRRSLSNMAFTQLGISQALALLSKAYDYNSCSYILKYKRIK